MKCINGLIVILFLIGLSSCFEISDDDLYEDFESQVVIEAVFNNIDTGCVVKVNWSVDPKGSENVNPINNARVILSGSNGETELLTLIEPGKYASGNMQGVPLNKYSLRVQIENQNYVAFETMDNPASVHRVELVYLDKHVEDEGYYIKLYIEKELNKTKHYKLNVLKNGVLFNEYSDLLIFNDGYSQEVLEYIVPYSFEVGDSVSVHLNAITEQMSKYYYELSKQSSNTFSNIQPPMINPPSNFSNNALGFFQVSAKTIINVVIQ